MMTVSVTVLPSTSRASVLPCWTSDPLPRRRRCQVRTCLLLCGCQLCVCTYAASPQAWLGPPTATLWVACRLCAHRRKWTSTVHRCWSDAQQCQPNQPCSGRRCCPATHPRARQALCGASASVQTRRCAENYNCVRVCLRQTFPDTIELLMRVKCVRIHFVKISPPCAPSASGSCAFVRHKVIDSCRQNSTHNTDVFIAPERLGLLSIV